MCSLILDLSSLIPYGEKSEEDKEAIKKLGEILYETECVTIYLSHSLIKNYRTVLPRELKHRPLLPPFQASFIRLLPELIKIVSRSRGLLRKTKSFGKAKFHVLETSRTQLYNVENLGLNEEDDKEILKLALASASQNDTFLVTTDSDFFEDLNQIELSKRYPKEWQKLKIVKPNDPKLLALLVSCKLEKP